MNYDAFLLGYAARIDGLPLKNNPFHYSTHDEEHNLWIDGWNEAKRFEERFFE